MRELSAVEARVLGVLVEKQATVPDTYPLSLNALASGCNQKNAREPLMQLADSELVVAIDALKALNLVVEVSGSRVARYEHNLPRALGLPGASVALLATLMLRGAQTSAELRLHSERLHRFADVSAVEGFLDELANKGAPKVRKLPRAAGERESRWVHLLCGAPAPEAPSLPDELDASRPAWSAAGAVLPSAAALSGAGAAAASTGSVLRFPIPEAKTLQYETVLPIRWGDMDAMGHVNNTIYFRYMEIVRIDWFRLLGATPETSEVGPIIINAFCTFHRQLEFPGEVRARLYVGALGRSTIDTYTTLERTDEPGLFYATGGAAVVWTDFKARKSVPLPDEIRRRLSTPSA